VPRAVNRASAVAIGETAGYASLIVRYPRESVGILLATCAVLAVYANALFMQKGPHPAPIFATRPPIVAPVAAPQPVTPVVRPVAVVMAPAAATPPASAITPMNRIQLIVEIQRALSKRGFYDGIADGIWGGKTDAGIREFARAAKLTINPEASEEMLRALTASQVSARVAAPAAPPRNDPIAALIAPSQRVLAIQRALTEFGYGQITPTGTYDVETRTAIEKFERDRNLPVTGDISDRVVRDLAALTGRPLE
jgi:peptidoglycan hydrolase-like protein with peptidoglycan-binding domain